MKYHRILSRLYNQPLAISQAKLDVLTSQVTMKLLAGDSISALPSDMVVERKDNAQALPKVAVINVFDSLVSKNGAGDSGSTSYETISSRITSAITNGAEKIVFYIDSPGGEVAGLFGLAAFIASLPAKYNVETIAVTDGMMTSAAYVIGAACSKVYATSSSIVGSIGVIMTLINTVEADKMDGVSYKILRSKDDKALINPHEPFASKAIEDAVKMLETLDGIMNESVSKYRPMLSVAEIIKLNGNTVLGEEALALNLIDGIVESLDSTLNSILKEASSSPKFNTISSTTTRGTNMSTLEEALAENIRLSSELQAIKANSTLEIAKAVQGEQDRVLGILDAATTFKLSMDTATKRIKAGSSVEATVEMFEAIKEAVQMATSVDTAAGIAPSLTEATTQVAGAVQDDFLSSFMQGVAALDAQPTFAGVR